MAKPPILDTKAKLRAQRIQLDYFKRLPPLRRWRRYISIALPALVGLWLLVLAMRKDEGVYAPGPVSERHGMFADDCAQCHVGDRTMPDRRAAVEDTGWKYWRDVSDQACLRCHEGAIHAGEAPDDQSLGERDSADQGRLFAHGCSNCHVEHRQKTRLAEVDDRQCTRCHADLGEHLKSRNREARYLATDGMRISSFVRDHPEFAVRSGRTAARVRLDADPKPVDAAEIKLNHEYHLETPGLRGKGKQPVPLLGPEGVVVQMQCADCHRPAVEQAYMEPISYEKHCMHCHLLEFDNVRFQTRPRDKAEVIQAFNQGRIRQYIVDNEEEYALAPHGTPEAIHSYLQQRYVDHIVEHPEEMQRQEVEIRRRLPRRARYQVLPVSMREWVDRQVSDAESRLFQLCKKCHTLQFPPGELPVVTLPNIPSRWFPHSRFDHKVHRALRCLTCHERAGIEDSRPGVSPEGPSSLTQDVLLPGIGTCRKCHDEKGGASTRCVECHTYHLRSTLIDFDGRLRIDDLQGRR